MSPRWKSDATFEDKSSALGADEQDPLISIRDRQQYNSIGSSSSIQKNRHNGKSFFFKLLLSNTYYCYPIALKLILTHLPVSLAKSHYYLIREKNI